MFNPILFEKLCCCRCSYLCTAGGTGLFIASTCIMARSISWTLLNGNKIMTGTGGTQMFACACVKGWTQSSRQSPRACPLTWVTGVSHLLTCQNKSWRMIVHFSACCLLRGIMVFLAKWCLRLFRLGHYPSYSMFPYFSLCNVCSVYMFLWWWWWE